MEGDAGSGQLNPTESDVSASDDTEQADTPVPAEAPEPAEAAEDSADSSDEPAPVARGRSRLGRGWLVGSAVAMIVLAGALAAGGYLAVRSHRASTAAQDADAAALAAARDCLLALHAPDPAAMDANQRKILECSTGDFVAQAPLMLSVIADAYAQADVHVEMLDMRTAVERHNPDDSIIVLAAFRVFVSSTNQQVAYRLRVTMAPDDGVYKIADIDQVAR
ncbi:hypothetical protein [Mycobacterium sp. 1274756.6]|uniref:hypothetical protein n=1 Tax=Mycobacterium sp. 1274756.6 TaxID=1834076 RepID=UPI000800B9DD|nr:hypothetical protein [Mycobacterium sp. 1274756.6]OBJ67444.1 hypothetical protein A5643_16960 [Mycobacterium sp. 1274756.6]